jgi:hypothetical protein
MAKTTQYLFSGRPAHVQYGNMAVDKQHFMTVFEFGNAIRPQIGT